MLPLALADILYIQSGPVERVTSSELADDSHFFTADKYS